MVTEWEQSTDPRFVAYLCWDTDAPLHKTYHKKELEVLPLFEWAGITVDSGDDPDERVVEVGRVYFRSRNPYTWEMLLRRFEYGRDVPPWLLQHVAAEMRLRGAA